MQGDNGTELIPPPQDPKLPLQILGWTVTRQQIRTTFKCIGVAALLTFGGWAFQNFLTLRGVVDLLASRINLGFVGLSLFGVCWILTNSTKSRTAFRILAGALSLLAILGLDAWAPKVQKPNYSSPPASAATSSGLGTSPPISPPKGSSPPPEVKAPKPSFVYLFPVAGPGVVNSDHIVWLLFLKHRGPDDIFNVKMLFNDFEKGLNNPGIPANEVTKGLSFPEVDAVGSGVGGPPGMSWEVDHGGHAHFMIEISHRRGHLLEDVEVQQVADHWSYRMTIGDFLNQKRYVDCKDPDFPNARASGPEKCFPDYFGDR